MILLLGATGLLGRNVLELLREKQLPVRVLVRRPLEGLTDIEQVQGSLLDDETLERAASGCEAIINCAGTTDMTLPSLEDFLPVNRDLPGRLCKIALKCGIPVLIHTSTANTIAVGTREHPADESTPFGPPYLDSPYAVSKLEGEKLLEAFAASHPEVRVVILNPGFMIGPFDSKPSSGQLLLAAWRKRVMFALPGAKSYLPVKDAAVAIVNALKQGRGRYLLTGQCLSMKEFYAMQARVCGYRQRLITMPAFTVRMAGWVGDLLKALGIRTMIYPHNVVQMLCEEWYSSERAREELDYPQTSLEQAIADFYRWQKDRRA